MIFAREYQERPVASLKNVTAGVEFEGATKRVENNCLLPYTVNLPETENVPGERSDATGREGHDPYPREA